MDEKSAVVLFILGVPATVGLIYAFVVRYKDTHRAPDSGKSNRRD